MEKIVTPAKLEDGHILLGQYELIIKGRKRWVRCTICGYKERLKLNKEQQSWLGTGIIGDPVSMYRHKIIKAVFIDIMEKHHRETREECYNIWKAKHANC